METILTAPGTLSVNDGISPELCSLEYTKISAMVTELNKMGPGTLLAKIDIKSAYCIIPVHPSGQTPPRNELERWHLCRYSSALRPPKFSMP